MTNNASTVDFKVSEVKARMENIAKRGPSFADFEYEVLHDKKITSLIPMRYIKILIQGYASKLD